MISTTREIEVRIRLLGGLGVSPNERVHWAVRSQRNRHVRSTVAIAALRTTVHGALPLDHVTVELEVVWPKGARRRDDDNLTAMCKPIIDGLADGRVIASDAPDHCTMLPPIQSRDKDAQVVVVIARIKGAAAKETT